MIIEIFSMYCPVCQNAAPRVNALYEAIEKGGMKGRIKLIGIGANNNTFEVTYFKKTYHIPFPLFPDGEMTIYSALGGEIRTPYFIAFKIDQKGGSDIFYTQTGGFENVDDFLHSIIKEAGLK